MLLELDLIEKLIDKCIKLINHKQDERLQLFKDHLEPLHKFYTDLHVAYMTRFREYKESLDGTRESLLRLIRIVENDRIFSDHARQKLIALSQIDLPKPLLDYVVSLREYLINPVEYQDSDDGHITRNQVFASQRWRGQLVEALKRCDRPRRTIEEAKRELNVNGANYDFFINMAQREGTLGMTECEKAERVIDFLVIQMQDLNGSIESAYAQARRDLISPI